MSTPVLYSIDFSPPCRAVHLTAAAIGLQLDIKNVNLLSGEHKQEAFTKINPLQSVPTLIDDGHTICDSHAICTYIIGKYGVDDDDALYPHDLLHRAQIDQRLHMDSGVLYPASRAANVVIFGGASAVPQQQVDNIIAALNTLEKLLEFDDYLAGSHMTVADLCCSATVTTMEVHVAIAADQYPKTREWLDRLAKLPYFEERNVKPVNAFRQFVAQRKEANK